MEKISVEKVVTMLREKGVEISKDEAKLILDFLRKLAEITVSNYLQNKSHENF